MGVLANSKDRAMRIGPPSWRGWIFVGAVKWVFP